MIRTCNSWWGFVAGGAIGALVSAHVASASMRTPLQVVATQPIHNEFGEVIAGHANMDPSERPLVQILSAPDGTIYPPGIDGSPHPNNPLLENGSVSIGHLVARALEQPGIFAATFSDPRPVSGKLFARVFNAPTQEESLFYGDSEVVTFNEGENATLITNVEMLDKIIDEHRDTDGDGLPDWWEHLNFGYATAVEDPQEDADGDGMRIWQEYQAGTDPDDAESFLNIVRVIPDSENPDDAVVEWRAVPDKVYRVQHTQDDLAGNPVFEDVTGDITATTEVMKTVIAGGLSGELGHYRIRVIAEEE